VWFNLCVDDFGVKYIGDENLKHLFQALRNETYELSKTGQAIYTAESNSSGTTVHNGSTLQCLSMRL
jgi:hypothetical protein